ncbi:hypothetical protein EJ03DRAFT_52435 [Teratosphaeria nubilosa]|uniref:Uncharacterized protein n=1 Tax=Teratosphaeria nubilosa TaxID=161662 RepID=A0A6G1KUR5_9PEZI|nr:hypothetical protein EJ03DRAFT_52435 [Teratosphaeria nubilosa]
MRGRRRWRRSGIEGAGGVDMGSEVLGVFPARCLRLLTIWLASHGYWLCKLLLEQPLDCGHLLSHELGIIPLRPLHFPEDIRTSLLLRYCYRIRQSQIRLPTPLHYPSTSLMRCRYAATCDPCLWTAFSSLHLTMAWLLFVLWL